ncbi:MAG: 3-keto-disaccharide hydrolase [Gemmataceae bacterium]
MRCLLLAFAATSLAADAPAWRDLVTDKPEGVFAGKVGGWYLADSVGIDPSNARRLAGKPGQGILVNGKAGRERDLATKEAHGDVELELEFLMPRGSNSGVKFHSVYEIQLCDSFGKKGELSGDTCGGIYPRANLLPVYKHIDKGIAPKVNACAEPGTWQKLTAIFLAPRFDPDGKKTANARIVKATLNGTTIHEDVELKTPTGHNWSKKEVDRAPLLIQGDHGPVAFRNARVRPHAAK